MLRPGDDLVLDRCICCGTLFINCYLDYPFCEDCETMVREGKDTSTIPTEEVRRVVEILAIN